MEMTIHKESCKGCGLCVNFCPKKALELSVETNQKGYSYAVCDIEKCVFCTACAVMCPDSAIEIGEGK